MRRALLNLLEKCAALIGSDLVRMAAIEKEVDLIEVEAKRRIAQRDDFLAVQVATDAVREAGPKRASNEGGV